MTVITDMKNTIYESAPFLRKDVSDNSFQFSCKIMTTLLIV